MKSSMDLCVAAGFDIRKLEPLDIFQLSGRIIADEFLTKRARAICPGPVLEEDARDKALAAMTPAERTALRERVGGVVPFPGKKP